MRNGYSEAEACLCGASHTLPPAQKQILGPCCPFFLAVGPGQNFPFGLGFPNYKINKSHEGRRISLKRKLSCGPWESPSCLDYKDSAVSSGQVSEGTAWGCIGVRFVGETNIAAVSAL